jgi:hypothetical protein
MENDSSSQPRRPMRRPHKGLPHFRYRSEETELAGARTSVRRWWWEYLRLSKVYWLLCKTSGAYNARTRDERLAVIYRKFGNVYDCTFDEWWRLRGAHIFQEQKEPPKVIEIAHDLSNLTEYRDQMVLVDIPLALSRVTIQRKISEILKRHELEVMHEVYCLHRELIAKPVALNTLNPKLYERDFERRADLFRIGKLLRISLSNSDLVGTAEEIHHKQNRMRASVGRFLNRADLLIANVEYGRFPVFKQVKRSEPRFSDKQLTAHLELEEEWWSVDLTSTLSGSRVIDAKRLHYSEERVATLRRPLNRRLVDAK